MKNIHTCGRVRYRNIILISTIWCAIVTVSFVSNYKNTKDVEYALALQTARSFFDQVLITRAWNALHNGVYVAISKETPPNEYLEDPARDLEINGTLKFTKVNPAFMTRQIAEIAARKAGIRFHITSLKPIRPDNTATAMEKESLLLFEGKVPEIGRIVTKAGKQTFFYMAPLQTEKSCLTCHAKQGYKVGDVRGGISVTLPFVPRISIASLLIGHMVIGLAGLLGIIFFGIHLERAHAAIKRQSGMDALTEIPNRRSFMERIEGECKRSRREGTPLVAIMADVDHFKWYNDTYGHRAGDDCLNRVAQSIRKSIKRPGDFCARYGGEEFVVVLSNTSIEGGMLVAETIRKNVRDMAIPHEKSSWKYVTLSLGVAISYQNVPTSCENIIDQADQALYRAKEQGRNRVEFFGMSGDPTC